MADKELSSEVRVLLAFAVSFLILILSRPLMVPPAPQKPAEPQTSAPAQPPNLQRKPGEPASQGLREPAAPEIAPPALSGPRQGVAEEQITVEGNLYEITFSTRGGAVKSWTLRRYRDEQEQPLDLVNPEAAAEFGNPLTFWVPDAELRQQINTALYVPSATGHLRAPATLSFEYSTGAIAARKEFTFDPDSYVVGLKSEWVRNGAAIGHELAWRGGFGDVHDLGLGGGGVSVFYREPQKMVRLNTGDVEGEQITASGPFLFAGIEDRFFSASLLPQDGALRVTAFHHEISRPGVDKKTPTLGIAVGSGDSPINRLRLFVGPKASDVLAQVHPQMSELVDYGWFAFIAQPLFQALRWTHDHIVSNYGWAIVFLTVAINMLLFPLKIKGLRSAMKMQKLQPQIKALQEKYKQYKMNDPRKKEMQIETMALYKKHGVNPFGSCWPMLLQIPFFYGFYKVLTVSIEMRQAPWFGWIQDLSAPESLPIKVLPILMCGTQFLLQKMSPATSPDPRQQKIMMFMPVMFLFFFWNLSSGLVLYWLTGNLVGIAQQWHINRTEMKHVIEERKASSSRKKQALARK